MMRAENRPGPNARGMATVLALALLVLLGGVTVSLAGLLRDRVSSAKPVPTAVQLRLMLMAGAHAAPQYVADWTPARGDRSWAVPLPRALTTSSTGDAARDPGGIVLVTVKPGVLELERLAVVEAGLHGQRASQRLRFVKGRSGWVMVEALLDE